jgi:O-antigen/teichoic acid export membrane protein
VSSVAVTAASLALSVAAGTVVHSPRALGVFRVLVLTVPINVLWAPAQAAIERRFDFRRMGFIEVVGDAVLYAVAVPLAWKGFGPWSLVAGFAASQAWLFGASLASSGLRLRLSWSAATARQLVGHGASYAAKDWVDNVGALVVPVVVGAFRGAAGVGLVSFAGRLVDTAAFAQRNSWRVGLVSMSTVEEPRRLRRGLEEGSLLQFLALGVPIVALAVASPALVPFLFGRQWSPAVGVTALVGLSTLLRGPGDIQGTLLFSRGRNLAVSTGALLRQLVIVAAAVLLVPRLGIDGYGVATLGTLAGVAYTRHVVRRDVVPFGYRRLVPFAVAFVPLVLMPLVPMPWSLGLLAPALGVVALPGSRRAVVDTWRLAAGALLRARRAPSVRASPPG